MKTKKGFQLAMNMLIHSKLRSWLTIIGIVIGIAAVVAIVSISQGAQRQLEEQLGSLGADVLTVSSGFSRAQGSAGRFGGGFGDFGRGGSTSSKKNLTEKDVNVIRAVPNVNFVMGTVSGRADVSYLGKSSTVSITGVDGDVWPKFITTDLDAGRYLSKGDSASIVVGYNVANSIFEDGMQINRQVTIAGKTFKIVGILQESGGGDSTIFMPITMARQVLDNVGEKEFASISVKINNVDLTDDTIADIDQKLMFSRGILQEKDKDFSVSSPKAFQETISSSLNAISLFLAAIAAISLIVGAVGIANSMFTSVLEKTKEIGIMKAIGAKNRDVMLIFLLNAGFIGMVGGIGGIILGILASNSIGSLTGGAPATGGRGVGRLLSFGSTYISFQLVIGAFLLAVLIGMIAGAIPAYRASKLKPVDALRYQ